MKKKQRIAVIGPNPIQSNPIHGWIQSMSNSAVLSTQAIRARVLDFAVVLYSLLRQRFITRIATIIVAQVRRTTHANYVGALGCNR